MNKKLNNFLAAVFVLAVILAPVSFLFGDQPLAFFEQSAQDNLLVGSVVFVGLEILSVVVVPVATLLLTPVAVAFFGPLLTAIYSITGWLIGSIIAFVIARKYGKPLVAKVFDLKKVEKYQKKIPSDMEFWSLVLLRVVFPVDVLSYALGLFSVVSLRRYLITTLIGISPFAFIFSYGGDALIMGNYWKFLIISISGITLFVSIFFMRFMRKNKN